MKKSGNTNLIIEELLNLNHLFQTANNSLSKEYKEINESFSPIGYEGNNELGETHHKGIATSLA